MGWTQRALKQVADDRYADVSEEQHAQDIVFALAHRVALAEHRRCYYSQRRMAERAQVSQSYISHFEAGIILAMSPAKLHRILAAYLGIGFRLMLRCS